MNTATEEAPTEVEPSTAETDGATPPTTSNEADSQGKQTPSEETLRAILRGEIPADSTAADPDGRPDSEAEVIARMFDDETGELLEEDPEPETASADTATKAKETEQPKDDATAAPKDGESDEDEPEDEEESKKPEKRRISIKRGRLNDRDFAIVQLADNEKITLTEAERRLFGDAPAVTEAKTEGDKPADTATETAESIQGQIAKLIEDRKAAEAALDVGKANDLNDQIYELRDRQRELKQQATAKEQTAAEAQAAQAAEALDKSIAKAVELYPDTASENSELFRAVEAERLTRAKSDPAFFQNPKWPIILAVEIAAELGIAPRTGAARTESTTKTAATITPKKTARPAPNPAPGNATATTNQTTEASLQAQLNVAKANRDTDGIKRIMREMEKLPAKA